MSSTSCSTTWWGCSSHATARWSETSTSGATSRPWYGRATATRRGSAREIPGGQPGAPPAFPIRSTWERLSEVMRGFAPVLDESGAYCTPVHGDGRFTARVPLHVPAPFSMATTTLPAGWSLLATRNREDLHQALLTSTCDRAFADVPVDWWDEAAAVWRPTSINRVLGGVWDVRRDVEVLPPGLEGNTLQRVTIAGVRLSRLLTGGVSRYWVARYQRQLVLHLLE